MYTTSMTEIVFIHPDGREERHSAKPGDSVMDVALDNGVAGIVAQCGGGCTCCTCHCWIGQPWLDGLNEPHQDELDMLEYAWGRSVDSRLSCQVAVTPAQAGMLVRIPEQQA